jgi:hypothetical protein
MLRSKLTTYGLSLALFVLALSAFGCGEEGGDMAITDVDPRTGSLAGEQPIRILGAHFRPDIGYRVYFGNQRATSVTVLDENTLLVTTPGTEEEGAVDITVLADNGPAFKVTGGFAYQEVSEAAAAATKAKGNLAY